MRRYNKLTANWDRARSDRDSHCGISTTNTLSAAFPVINFTLANISLGRLSAAKAPRLARSIELAADEVEHASGRYGRRNTHHGSIRQVELLCPQSACARTPIS